MDFPRQTFEMIHSLKITSFLSSEDTPFGSLIESPVFKTTASRIGYHFSLVFAPRGCNYSTAVEIPHTSYPDTLGVFLRREFHLDSFRSRKSDGPISISFFVDVNDKRKCVTEVLYICSVHLHVLYLFYVVL